MTPENTRRVQIAFLIVMSVSATQVLWWIFDQAMRTRQVHDRWTQLFAADAIAAQELLTRGASSSLVSELFPHLEVTGHGVVVARSAIDELLGERRSRLNQYTWEGGFFLFVLLAGMGVVWRALRQDRELRQRQDNFLAAVSHELKSPLASVQLAAETMALRDLPKERRQQLVSRILADLQRLSTMVTNLLDTNRLEQGQMEMEARAVDLSGLVQEVAEELESRALDAGVALHVELPEDLPAQQELQIEADPVGVRTVLRNLIDNAIKACDAQGGGRVDVVVELGGDHNGDHSGFSEHSGISVTVRDDGVGFEASDANKLFDKFYRTGNELRRTSAGSGLGLYITRRIVELEGGRVAANSQGPGEGAEVRVTWPHGGRHG